MCRIEREKKKRTIDGQKTVEGTMKTRGSKEDDIIRTRNGKIVVFFGAPKKL
jgi:uncharacterized protein YqhQ